MPSYFLGVDGGQSSTTALVGDEAGRILGRGTAGPCNHVSGTEAEEKFRRVIGSCIAEACMQAGVGSVLSVVFRAACFGFSGGAEDKVGYARDLIRSERYKFTHDAEIALTGALAGGPGIGVIAGTGSMAWGRTVAGEECRAGGWGYIFGDEGGAFDIVRNAVRAALAYEEGWGPATALLPVLLHASGFPTANRLLHACYTPEWPRSRVAQWAPVVSAAAEDGDIVAQKVLRRAAELLFRYCAGVWRRLFFVSGVPIATVGGAWNSSVMHSAFSEHAALIGCPVVPPAEEPAAGALREARLLQRAH